MCNKYYTPKPVLDTLPEAIELYKRVQDAKNPTTPIQRWLQQCFCGSPIEPPCFAVKDYQAVLRFLYSYRGSKDTFGAYRRELERLLQWSWFLKEQSVTKHKREDIETFIEFCIRPYKRWICLKKVARFKLSNGQKVPHPQWRTFEAHVTKKARKEGTKPSKSDYQLSQAGLKALFAILSRFCNYEGDAT